MRRRRAALALSLGLVVLVAGWTGMRALETRRIRAALETATREMADGHFAGAQALLVALNAQRPGRADILLPLGLCEQSQGRIDGTLDVWSCVAPGSIDAGPLSLRRGILAIEHGRLAIAEEALTRALREGHVNRDETRSALARVLRLQGRLVELRERLTEGLGDSVVPAELLRELWRLDTEPLPIEGVRSYLEMAEREAPNDDRVQLGWANLAARTGRFDEAAALLDRCDRARPADTAVWWARLNLARTSGDVDAVRRLLVLPYAGRFRPTEALSLRAWFAAQRADRETEKTVLEELLKLDPGDSEALDRLAELAAESNASETLAELRRLKAKLDEARDGYKKRLAAGDIGRARELSRLARTLGRRLEARGWMILAGESEHDHPRVRERLARAVEEEPGPIPAERLHVELTTSSEATLSRAVKVQAPSGPLPAFVDIAETSGLRFTFDNGESPERQFPESGSGGVGLIDFDGDGFLDVYCVQGGRFPPAPGRISNEDRLFRNRGDGTFDDVTKSSGIADFPGGYGHGVAVGDFNGDGRPDLFITRWRSYALYQNRGDGTFVDVTNVVGLGGDRDWPTSAAFADLDNDGDLDLYVCHYLLWDDVHPKICRHPQTGAASYCDPSTLTHRPDHIFMNDAGRFVDVTNEAGFIDPAGRGLGVVAADLDEDGRIDIYVANDMSANYLFRNLGDFRFEEVGAASGVAANAAGGYQAGMGVGAGDLDADGRLDLVVTNFYGESTTLFRNLGGGIFSDNTAAFGLAVPTRFMLGFGVAFIDADNDRNLDLLIANGHVNDFRPDTPYAMPTQLLLGSSRGRLTDVTNRIGRPFEKLRVGRGLASGDIDNDGRIDAIILAHNEPVTVLHNRTPHENHFVTLRLEGTKSNRDAVGARIRILAGGRTRVAQRTGGGSYQSANDPRLHFGLGTSTTIDAIEIAWPSGRTDRYESITVDQGYLLREGDAELKPLPEFNRPN